MFAESGHVDAIFCQAEDLEAGQVKGKKKAIKPQDLHEILDVVLESLHHDRKPMCIALLLEEANRTRW
jgi:hypothetical protein